MKILMTTSMQSITTFVNSDGTTAITCPACSILKTVSVNKFRHKKHVLKVRCSCKTFFNVELNYRLHYRKSVNLSGTYKTFRQYDRCKGITQITNISAGGLQYRVVGVNKLFAGGVVDLDFQLGDKNNSRIKKRAVVRYSHNNVVGCEFMHRGESDRALGFYLRF